MGFLNFDVTLSGLLTGQNALKVTQNNIANAHTDGYARQRLEIMQNGASSQYGLDAQIGLGAYGKEVTRIVDNYLVQSVREAQNRLGYHEEMKNSLTEIETIFNESGEQSITNMMSKMFDAFADASKYPENKAYRNVLLGNSKLLTDNMNLVSRQLNDMKRTVDANIETKMGRVNQLTDKIASINKKITENATENPNTLLDERDRYMNDLSKLIDVKYTKGNGNTIDVHANGVLLVSGYQSNPITGHYSKEKEEWMLSANNTLLKPEGGEIKASIEFRNTILKGYETQLNTVSKTLITEMNKIHSAGFGLDNTTGIPFFVGTDASSMAINPDLVKNPEKIALSSKSGVVGNSDQGKLMAGLRDEKLGSLGNISVTEFHGAFVFDMATQLNVVSTNASIQTNVVDGLKEQRDNVQGVNLDEEMSNLMKFQRYYQSNAKMLGEINKTFQSLLDII